MNNKSLLWTCLLMVAGLGGAPGLHAADEAGWYAGAGVGRSDVKRASSWTQVTGANLLARGLVSSTVIESHGTAWKLFGGYQFNENLAVEGGYHDLGRLKGLTVITAPASTLAGRWDAYAASVAVVGSYPVVNRFAVFAKGGLALSRLTVDVPAPALYSPSATRVQPLLGVGVKFDFMKSFGVRGEFERFNNVGDGSTTGQSAVNVWSVSAQYRF